MKIGKFNLNEGPLLTASDLLAHMIEYHQNGGVMAEAGQPVQRVGALVEAARLVGAWDHTGNSHFAFSGDIQSALETLQATVEQLEQFQGDPEDQKQVGELTDFLRAALTGFEYRQQKKLPSINRQRDAIRRKFAEDDIAAAGDLLETLARQPDATDVAQELRDEYALVSEIREELSEKAGQYEFDIDRLWTKVFTLNQGLDSETSISGALLTNYKQVAILSENLRILMPLATMQGREKSIKEMQAALPEIEAVIVDRVVSVISQVTERISRKKVALYDYSSRPQEYRDLKSRERIAAVIADLRNEFAQAGVGVDAGDIEKKLREIDEAMKASHSEDHPPKKNLLQMIAKTFQRPVRQANIQSMQQLYNPRQQLRVLRDYLSQALAVFKEAEEFLQEMKLKNLWK